MILYAEMLYNIILYYIYYNICNNGTQAVNREKCSKYDGILTKQSILLFEIGMLHTNCNFEGGTTRDASTQRRSLTFSTSIVQFGLDAEVY